MMLILNEETISNIVSNADDARDVFKLVINRYSDNINTDKKVLSAYNYSFLVFAQAILTLADFIVVKSKLGVPKNFYESLMMIIDNNLIDLEELSDDDPADLFKRLVEIRDEILHGYPEITIETLKDMVEDFPKFELIYERIKEKTLQLVSQDLHGE